MTFLQKQQSLPQGWHLRWMRLSNIRYDWQKEECFSTVELASGEQTALALAATPPEKSQNTHKHVKRDFKLTLSLAEYGMMLLDCPCCVSQTVP